MQTRSGCIFSGPWKKLSVSLLRRTILGVCRCCAPGTALSGSAGGLPTGCSVI